MIEIDEDLAWELVEFLDDHSDAEYIDGQPSGNRAMSLLMSLEDAITDGFVASEGDR